MRYTLAVATAIQVAQPPPKPLMVFDGDCNFCTYWIRRWQAATADRVDYIPFQAPMVAERLPEIPRAQFESAVQLITPEGQVYSGADAVFRCLACNPAWGWLLWLYQHAGGFALACDGLYRFVARHRMSFSFLTRLLWGYAVARPEHQTVRSIFLRGLGLIYLIAFLSLWSQIHGLLGAHGILPAADFMDAAQSFSQREHLSLERFHLLPTWCWISASDPALDAFCGAGSVLSLLLIIGVAPSLCLLLLWTLYLSLTVIGREFLSFQWDILLLETGFLAIFFAPLKWLPRAPYPPVPRVVLWLLRWLLFRLMFESGCVKLLSGDPTWRHLQALDYHYQTQPLPTWLAWYAQQGLPWFQHTCLLLMFAIELGFPFLIFAPRRPRLVACAGFIILQVWILLTGNYGFFNYLTILLSLLLLDDAAVSHFVSRFIPPFASSLFRHSPQVSDSSPAVPQGQCSLLPTLSADSGSSASAAGSPVGRTWAWPRWITAPLLGLILVLSAAQLSAMFSSYPGWLRPAQSLNAWLSSFRSFNSYGLFAVMTTTRAEIIVEGSNDRQTWRAYEFKYKPGPVARPPAFVAPHQPRLDWQMWFAALGNYRQNDWFVEFGVRLLSGSPDVLRLLESNPFPEKPPRFIRARVYEYRFTTPAERARTGAWWSRQLKGEYLPVISLRQPARFSSSRNN